MSDGQYGLGPLINMATISLDQLQEVESAALKAVMASCIGDDKEQIAGFSNTI